MHGATLISRMPAGWLPPRRALLALAAVACLILAACSPGVDYPSLFPAVHDIPPPRTDSPLDANQVQQATEDLITARDRLNTEAQSAQGKNSANSPAKPAAKSSANSSAKSSAKSSAEAANGPTAAKTQPGMQASGREPPASDAAQTAGAETK